MQLVSLEYVSSKSLEIAIFEAIDFPSTLEYKYRIQVLVWIFYIFSILYSAVFCNSKFFINADPPLRISFRMQILLSYFNSTISKLFIIYKRLKISEAIINTYYNTSTI